MANGLGESQCSGIGSKSFGVVGVVRIEAVVWRIHAKKWASRVQSEDDMNAPLSDSLSGEASDMRP